MTEAPSPFQRRIALALLAKAEGKPAARLRLDARMAPELHGHTDAEERARGVVAELRTVRGARRRLPRSRPAPNLGPLQHRQAHLANVLSDVLGDEGLLGLERSQANQPLQSYAS